MVDQTLASNYPVLKLALDVHRNKRNKPMEIIDRPYLHDIYREDSQFLIVMKAVQTGITEWLICVVMVKTEKGWSLLYTWPTIDLRNDFVSDRLDRLFELVPYYKAGLKTVKDGTDNKGLKHLWTGTVWFTGSNSSTAFISRDADMGVVDELDKCDQEKIAMMPDRLDASDKKYLWKVSNPTHSKFGIHKEYLLSNQQEWHIVCADCGLEQSLDFFKNVVKEVSENNYELIDNEWNDNLDRDIDVCCRDCNKPIDRLGPGRYIAQNPGSKISGYHISQLFSPTKPIHEIYAHFLRGQGNLTEMQLFFNSRLGLPYEGVGEKLSPALLESKCMDDYLMPSKATGCTAGIDVGKLLNIRISEFIDGKRKAVFIGTVRDFDRLEHLLKRYGVEFAVIDILPETRKVEELQAINDCVWACNYTTTTNPDNIETSLIKAEKRARNEEAKKISIDRTMIIDGMVADILNGNNRLPKNFRSIKDYTDQMEAPTRIDVETNKRKYYAWDEAGKPDHYFHAETLDYLASLIREKIGDMTPGYA